MHFNNNNNRRNGNNFSFDFDIDNSRNRRESRSYQPGKINWSEENLTEFRKDFCQEDEEVSNMSNEEVDSIREKANMLVFGNDIPKPFKTFDKSGIPSTFLQHLGEMGIDEPTPIQQQGIPMALSGRDIIGVSRTGSGKTLAYLIPAIVHIQAQPIVKRGEGPIGLVLAPTRELTRQINDEISKYVRSNPQIQIKHAAVYGGSDRHRQISQLRESPDILVATPGRLIDLLESGETNFKRTTYLVLDEADRMLDMGFRDALETILSYVRPDKQVLMWSATWPKEIQSIAHKYMDNPIRVQIGTTDLHANHNIHQCFRHLENPRMKTQAFAKDVREIVESNKKCLVFCNTKRGADSLESVLMQENINARSIHGDKTQQSRERILSDFRKGYVRTLIATDVVARGIDIRDISVVICFDMPTNLPDYVHRIGRTGRGDDRGVSLSYITNDDIGRMGSQLVKLLNKSKQTVPEWLQQRAY